MSEQELLELAKDQLDMACENLANQKDKSTEAYKMASFEVESCKDALNSIERKILLNHYIKSSV
jgi:hypothetical protein